MGWAVRLHPVAVMIALILGASLGGIWGMLLAVPMMGVAKLVFVHFYETRVLGNWGYEANVTGDGLIKEAGESSEIPDGQLTDGADAQLPVKASKPVKTSPAEELKEAKKGA